MKKILIANRGEIACRIIKSCKKLNIHSIAVYSDIDSNSKHVRLADESINIGNSKAQESYLSSKKIIDAALKTKADAIHPGYGFLSENAEFAQNVIDSGLIWIGPKPDTIISMGNKDVAREKAINSNLPICPGLKNDDLSSENLEKKCLDIGYPILIKASAGGGGIGMNIVNNFSELKTAIDKNMEGIVIEPTGTYNNAGTPNYHLKINHDGYTINLTEGVNYFDPTGFAGMSKIQNKNATRGTLILSLIHI